MRKRTLSDDGQTLYLNGITPPRPMNWVKRIVYNLFHSDYDERLEEVVFKCRQSTQGLCAIFESDKLHDRLDAGIMHTVRLILTRDNKSPKKRHIEQNFRFFLDVLSTAHKQHDHQTAHMLYLALTHPAIHKLCIKRPTRTRAVLKKLDYGEPSYQRHIDFWHSVRSDDILPSLIAFKIFIRRREFAGRVNDADDAKYMMELFKYLGYEQMEILSIYNQKKMSTKELSKLTTKFIFK